MSRRRLASTKEPRPDEARRLTEKLEIHYTPKHGSWLNVAEIELSALARRIDDRTPEQDALKQRAGLVEAERNVAKRGGRRPDEAQAALPINRCVTEI